MAQALPQYTTPSAIWNSDISEHRFRERVLFVWNDFSDPIIPPKVAKTDAVYYIRCSVRDDSCLRAYARYACNAPHNNVNIKHPQQYVEDQENDTI